MKLAEKELEWVRKRMGWYGIKFQEIYDELFDHITLAIEAERSNGNQRTIDVVYDYVAARDFGGYLGIDKIVKKYERAYHKRIRKGVFLNLKFYFNKGAIALLACLVIAGFYLPNTKATLLILLAALIITAAFPMAYAYRNAPKVRVDDGKQSIVKSYMKSRSALLLMMVSCLLNLIGGIAKEWNITFLSPAHFHPIVYMLLLFFFIIYGMSIIRLCKQEFKIVE